MKSESVKKSPEKSKHVLEKKAQNGQLKKLQLKETNMFAIIAKSFVQEQLIIASHSRAIKHSRAKMNIRS